ncbi:MAG: hypothetical protein OEZ01_15215, partial [Candidatus Heimdallarchaeota archaeon]|nr:hypothetical protein [Candidatus Heimdallarchaeota archaeon]
MVFDELDQEEKSEIHYLKPTRKNLDPLLGMNRKQTLLSIIIYAISIIIAYFVLSRYFLTENNLHYWWYFSFFIGIGAFIDQLIHPDENSKTGYFVLLIIYYIIYKFVVFSLLLYYIFLYIDYDYELHYFEEILPGMTLFLFWAIGQKVGYYIENKKLISQLNQRGPMSLNDIDRLKIFLYQVKRRSFLRMLIQRDKAKFMYVP